MAHKVGTKSGVLSKLLSRNMFQVAKHTFLKVEDVPSREVGIRRTATVRRQRPALPVGRDTKVGTAVAPRNYASPTVTVAVDAPTNR